MEATADLQQFQWSAVSRESRSGDKSFSVEESRSQQWCNIWKELQAKIFFFFKDGNY